jgi:hypothetical protein
MFAVRGTKVADHGRVLCFAGASQTALHPLGARSVQGVGARVSDMCAGGNASLP